MASLSRRFFFFLHVAASTCHLFLFVDLVSSPLYCYLLRYSFFLPPLETLFICAIMPMSLTYTPPAPQLRGGAPRLARNSAGPFAGRRSAKRSRRRHLHARQRRAHQRDAGRRLQSELIKGGFECWWAKVGFLWEEKYRSSIFMYVLAFSWVLAKPFLFFSFFRAPRYFILFFNFRLISSLFFCPSSLKWYRCRRTCWLGPTGSGPRCAPPCTTTPCGGTIRAPLTRATRCTRANSITWRQTTER